MPKTLTLLEQAKAFRPKNVGKQMDYTDEHIELAIAWAKGEVRHTQVVHVLGRGTRQNAQNVLGALLREAVRRGKLVEPK